jgi:hypothetical protein
MPERNLPALSLLQRQRGVVIQQGLHRQKAALALRLVHRFQRRQRDAALQPERAGGDAPQRRQMRAATERLANVLAERADVGPFAAEDSNFDS